MKKLLFIIIFFTICSISFAQGKTDRYCQVTVFNKNGFTAQRKVKISFGNEADLFNLKDTTVFQRLKKIEVLNTETDVLNFMTKMNWNLVTVLSATQFNIEIFYFKRQFDISEFND